MRALQKFLQKEVYAVIKETRAEMWWEGHYIFLLPIGDRYDFSDKWKSNLYFHCSCSGKIRLVTRHLTNDHFGIHNPFLSIGNT